MEDRPNVETTAGSTSPRVATSTTDMSTQLRHAMAAYPTGVALVAARVGEQSVGMLMNSLTSVSLEPPLLSLAFSRTSPTWELLRPLRVWGVSILGGADTEQAMQLCRPSATRFDGVRAETTADGALLLPDAAATFVVGRHRDVDAGDHVLALVSVLQARRNDPVAPIVSYESGMSPWHI